MPSRSKSCSEFLRFSDLEGVLPTFDDRRDLVQHLPELHSWFRTRSCALPLSGGAWIFGRAEFLEESIEKYGWDFIRNLSLEACCDDTELLAEINNFWAEKILIGLNPVSDYEYIAASAKDGSVFIGFAPEFELSAKLLCTSFVELIRLVSGLQVPGSIYQSDFIDHWGMAAGT